MTGRRGPARLSSLAVALLVWLATAVLSAGPASAHAVLLITTPPSGYSAPEPVRQVSLTFTEPVTATAQAIRIDGPTADLRAVARASGGGRTLTVATPLLRAGVYVVTWQVTADDGDVVTGSYGFAVGSGTDPAGLASRSRLDAITGSLLFTAALRWLLFAMLAVALGGLVGTALVTRLQRAAATVGAAPLPLPRLLSLPLACLVGAAAAAGLAAHATNGASFLRGLVSLRPWALHGASAAPLSELLLFGFAGALLWCSRAPRLRWLAGLSALPLLGVAVAEGLRGHLHEQQGVAGAALVAVHVAAAAAWTGALVVVLLAAARWRAAGRSNATWQLVHAYSRTALLAYLLVIATGATAAVLLFPSWSALTSTRYGIVLVAKLVVVAAVTVLALVGRVALRRTEAAVGAYRPRATEPLALTGALLAAAVLVSFAPPRLVAAAAAPVPPPAPAGPVVQLGALAGQLTVGVTVSAGQIRVQVSNPSSDDNAPRSRRETFTLSAATSPVTVPGGPRARDGHQLRLVACGDGCFAGPAQVTAPGLTLSLRVGSRGWHGGTVALRVPWTPVPADAELRSALTRLAATPAVSWKESVSSDTSRPVPAAVTLHDTGRDFLASEVYGDGGGLQPVLLPGPLGLRHFAFGVGGAFFIEMTTDREGKLVTEQVITPNHLIVRTFRP